jgi:riboflavin synthase
MFNGIIFNQGKVVSLKKSKKSIELRLKTNLKIKKNEIGSSISCNGVCLTLISMKNKFLNFYVSNETLKRTNFDKIKIGDNVNIEKSLQYGDKISGHYVQGHVDTTAKILKITKIDKSWSVHLQINKNYSQYFEDKASICVNGVSLTVSKTVNNKIQLNIIPHTLKLTNLIFLKRDSIVNIEIDIFSKYLRNLNK